MPTLGNAFIDDGVAVDINGVIAMDTSAQVQALYPGVTITPTVNFGFTWNGVLISFVAGESQPLSADLIAALTAAGAPFTTP